MEITSKEIIKLLEINKWHVSLTKRELTDALIISTFNQNTSLELTDFIFTNPIHLVIQDFGFCNLDFSRSTFQNSININVHGEGLAIINVSDCEFNMGLKIESNNIKTEVNANNSKANGEIELGNSKTDDLSLNLWRGRRGAGASTCRYRRFGRTDRRVYDSCGEGG